MPVNNALYDVSRQDVGEVLAQQLSVPNALNFGKGMVSGAAGLPGDIFDLAKMLRAMKQGYIPNQQPNALSTDGLGQAMGADVNSGAFLAGNIGVPDITDLAKLAPFIKGGLTAAGIHGANKLMGLKQGGNADEIGGALMAANAPGADVSTFAGEKSLANLFFAGDDGIGKTVKTSHGELNAWELKANIEAAKKMELDGADVNKIWDETGFFKGADDKWRYEIDDSAARLTTNARSGVKDYGVRRQGTVLDHESLYAAYPDLGDMSVMQSPDRNYAGSYTGSGGVDGAGEIHLNFLDDPTDPGVTKTNLHELQHAVQDKEGFARGGNLNSFTGQTEAMKTRDAHSWRREMRRLSDETGVTDWDKLDQLAVDEYTKVGAPDWIPSETARRLAKDPEFAPDSWMNETISKYGLDKQVTPHSPHEMYKRIAGEVEARNVEKRLPFGSAMRRTVHPLDTEDISRAEQIVRFR